MRRTGSSPILETRSTTINPQIQAYYIAQAFSEPYREVVMEHFRRMCDQVRFDAIAATGTSGLLFGPLLAHAFGKKLVVVRKDNDGSHTSTRVEGWAGVERVVFLDDFVDMGETARRVDQKLREYLFDWEWAGAFLWNNSRADDRWRKVEFLQAVPVFTVFANIKCHQAGTIWAPEYEVHNS